MLCLWQGDCYKGDMSKRQKKKAPVVEGDPAVKGSRWMNFKECSGTCSCKYTSTRGSAVPESCKDRRSEKKAAKYEINIRFLEPSGFEGIATEA